MPSFDLDAYLYRIGYAGPRSTALDALAAIHKAHATAIAFENLDPWLGVPVGLDLDSLQAKLVGGQRGGYCYEHNLLLGEALRALGFSVANLAARVRWGVPEGAVRPRTHMLLAVNVATERYLVDAGFGGQTLTGPLRLDRKVPQITPHGAFRLQRQQGDYELQAQIGSEWRPLYAFDLQPQQLADYEMPSWYLCNFPGSHFRTTLMAARPVADGRRSLMNTRLSFHGLDGRSEVRVLASVDEMRSTLTEVFGVDLSRMAGLDDRLADLLSAPEAGA